MALRFSPDAAAAMRTAIREADGVEVFAIGDVLDGTVVAITVTCRGQEDRVTALIDRPKPGQVVIHNHPSGVLLPSDADMHLAGVYGNDGVGFVIVDSPVERSRWVVEPHVAARTDLDPARVERFFREDLKLAIPDFELRGGQLDMALAVTEALNHGRPLAVEAGTGTGKSLAYLVPAAMWALQNAAKVVISTHTKALQGQLVGSDLPVLARAGLPATYAVLQGRNNYLCKRRLGVALADDTLEPEERQLLDAIAAWDQTSADGTRGDLPFPVDPQGWERVESDTDLTLAIRCPHYAECRFYQARRSAAAVHLLVVNHALLLADLALKADGGSILPKFDRVVLDEGHHLEDAATGAASERLTDRAIGRAVGPLLPRRKRPGVLDRMDGVATRTKLSADERTVLETSLALAMAHARSVVEQAPAALEVMADAVPPEGPLRVTEALERSEAWQQHIAPAIVTLGRELEDLGGALDAVLAPFDEKKPGGDDVQPLLDLRRASRRVHEQARVALSMLAQSDEIVRWLDATRFRDGPRRAVLNAAPIEVAATLKKVLWTPFPGAVATSATLTVGKSFDYWGSRVGLRMTQKQADPEMFERVDPAPSTAVFPSPFDHFNQALLALPRDLPSPEDEDFLARTADYIIDAVRISEGGAFVLCTSYQAARYYGQALRAALPPTQPVLVQGEGERLRLLERFREDRRSVLCGTDSFWEGVSVKGDALRLVIIPRLPFRVPTEPLRIARHERIEARGGDAFRQLSLPDAVIKLRQGY
jgi:ATP-dependent DNA helicase DinG